MDGLATRRKQAWDLDRFGAAESLLRRFDSFLLGLCCPVGDRDIGGFVV